MFYPKFLPQSLEKLSLEGNKIEKLEFVFGIDIDNEYYLERVDPFIINFSSNLFTAFPYDALKNC